MYKNQNKWLIINLICCKNLYDFYNEVEIKLCGGLNSGFGRNLDALIDVMTGGFGELQFITSNEVVNIYIKKSKLLDNKLINILIDTNEKNKNEKKKYKYFARIKNIVYKKSDQYGYLFLFVSRGCKKGMSLGELLYIYIVDGNHSKTIRHNDVDKYSWKRKDCV